MYAPTGVELLTFAGEAVDSPTGLVYLSARYMDPATGRFFALDPVLGSLSMPQTLNRFVYCANSPLIHVDPTGRLSFLAGVAIAAAISFGAGVFVSAVVEQDPHWEHWVSKGIGYGIAGGIAAASGGNPFAAGAGAMFGGMVTRVLNGQPVTLEDAFVDYVFGLATAGVTGSIFKFFGIEVETAGAQLLRGAFRALYGAWREWRDIGREIDRSKFPGFPGSILQDQVNALNAFTPTLNVIQDVRNYQEQVNTITSNTLPRWG